MIINNLKEINKKKIRELDIKLKEADKEQLEILKKEILIQKKIETILNEDEAVFFKIQMEDALKILSKLVSEGDLKETYLKLISADEFKRLKDCHKI